MAIIRGNWWIIDHNARMLVAVNALIALPLLLLLQPDPPGAAGALDVSSPEVRIDRSLQVVVYPDHLRLQYDLGLSPAAAKSMLTEALIDLPDDEEPRALMEAVAELVIPEIQRRCRLTANGEPLKLVERERLIFPKHYVQLTCIYESALPAAGEVIRLQLVDGSFRGRVGDHVIALKTAGGVQIQSSTVPLILARVPRQSFSNDSAAEREAARRAEAVVLRPRVELTVPEARAPSPSPNSPESPDAGEPVRAPPVSLETDWKLLRWVALLGILALIAAVWWTALRR